jgi:dihydroneopterin triphosphate diphosphatase
MAEVISQIVDVCVFRRKGNGAEYLILQRSQNEELYPNLWQILTGTIAPNETAFQTAIRELEEETALPIKRLWTVPFVDSFFVTPQDAIQLSPVFAVEVKTNAVVKLSREHQKHEWLKLKRAKKKLVWPGQRQVLDVVQEYIVDASDAGRLLEIKINSEGK